MVYDLFPSLDQDLNFPPEILQKLSNAPEFRSFIIPMTKSFRDNLSFDNVWHGRVIYNTTTKTLETWDEQTKSWRFSLNDNFIPPAPKYPWDKNFVLPVAVRDKLKTSEELKHFIIPISEENKRALTDTQLWVGRTVYNLTFKQLESWVGDSWQIYYTPKNTRAWTINWIPVIKLYPSNRILTFPGDQNSLFYGAKGIYTITNKLVRFGFSLYLTAPDAMPKNSVSPMNTGEEYRMVLPIPSSNYGLQSMHLGRMWGTTNNTGVSNNTLSVFDPQENLLKFFVQADTGKNTYVPLTDRISLLENQSTSRCGHLSGTFAYMLD